MASFGNKSRLVAMFILTFGFFLVEILVGYMTNSMALVADSFHMLSDVVALIVAFISVAMAPKKWSRNTFGWARAEVLGALVNAVFLIALCFSIVVESIKRFIHVEDIEEPMLVLVVGTAGLVVNLIGLCLFRDHHGHGHSHSHGHSHTHDHSHDESHPEKPKTSSQPAAASASQMNMTGVFLHVLADALGSVVVIISALIIWLTEWEYRMYVDPVLSLILVFLILSSTWPLLWESSMILLQTVPTHIEVDDLKQKLIKSVEGVLAVHEFHIWRLAGNRVIVSAHIRCKNIVDYNGIAENLKEFFHNEGIHSTTIQPEFVEDINNFQMESCIFKCDKAGNDKSCIDDTCCGPITEDDTDNGSEIEVIAKKDSIQLPM